MPTAAEDQCRTFELEALPHLDMLHRVAVMVAGDAAQADDLVQDTMLRAYRSWYQYQRGTNVRAWLLTILRHTFASEYRSQRRHEHNVDFGNIEAITVFGLRDIDPEARLLDRLAADEVLRAIGALPVYFREALVLRDIEGLSYAEAAQVMAIRVGTAKSRVFRARRLLRRELYDYAAEMGYIQPSLG